MDSRETPSMPLVLAAMLFTACLIIGFLLPVKVMTVGPFILPGGAVIFPLSYGISAVVTEVWGYAVTRRIIWAGLGGAVLLDVACWLTETLPPAPFYHHSAAFSIVFADLPRILLTLASGYLVGEFVNALILSRTKVRMDGRLSAVRLWIAPMVAQLIALGLFVPLAYWGTAPARDVLGLTVSRLVWAVLYHTTMLTALVQTAAWLKRTTHTDTYDVGVNLNPFSL